MIWQQNTYYNEGQIVYPTAENGFYYVVIQAGTSKSETESYSNKIEPIWTEINTIDNFIVWETIPYTIADKWESKKLYQLNDIVNPITDNFEGLYSYIAKRILAEPNWPTLSNEIIVDNTVIFQCRISVKTFLPSELTTDELTIEFYKIVDYLIEFNTLYLKDTLFKFKDRSKIQVDALQSYITEQGYEYIVNVLELTKEQLETLTEYLNLIHFLKGTRRGLELVMNLLGIVVEIEEWWESDPKEEPHTFSLDMQFNLGNIRHDTVVRVIDFVSHYVFPKLRDIIITYEANIVNAGVMIAGVFDQDIPAQNYDVSSLCFATHAILETTIYADTKPPDTTLLAPIINQIYLLYGNVALSLPERD